MVNVCLTNGALLSAAEIALPEECGARIYFEGVVRRVETGREISSLEYEVYEPMTSRELEKLAEEIKQQYQLLAIVVEHSFGKVPVGKVSFRLRIASMHRAEGLKAMEEFIDRMKRDVPIWKNPVWVEANV